MVRAASSALTAGESEDAMRAFHTVVVVSSLAAFGSLLAGCQKEPAAQPSATAAVASPPAQTPVERGEMLVIGGGCHDCHTPKKMGPNGPEPDMSKMLSGHPASAGALTAAKQDPGSPWIAHTNEHLTAWSGPWGVSYAANLTPDQNTGLGTWTEETFVKALQTGKHMGASRPILPPMPWNWYSKMPENDLKAIFAYLKSIPAIANEVPVPTAPDGKPMQ
jgi:hypothetical protein